MRNVRRHEDGRMLYEGRMLYGDTYDKTKIKGIDMIPTDYLQCNVRFAGKSVYSNCRFLPGDIIERCPVRRISKDSLYTREVRDMAFELVPGEQWGIPMGYCQFYDVVDRLHPDPNCKYEWQPNSKCVIIRAIKEIPKDSVLVLDASEEL